MAAEQIFSLRRHRLELIKMCIRDRYQALYPAAGITRAVRREYTSANAY